MDVCANRRALVEVPKAEASSTACRQGQLLPRLQFAAVEVFVESVEDNEALFATDCRVFSLVWAEKSACDIA